MTQIVPIALDLRLQRTRKALRDALLLLLNQKSFDQISIREITAEAKVGYATFYRHYASKEGLLHELADAEVKNLVETALPVVFIENMRESVRVVCNRVQAQRGLWHAMLTGGASGVLREEFLRETKKLTGRYAERLSGWLPPELHMICATGATIDVLTWWLMQKPMPPVDYVVDLLDRIIDVLATHQIEALSSKAV